MNGEENGKLPEGWATAALKTLVKPSSEKVEPKDCPNARYLSLEHLEPHSNNILAGGCSSDVNSTKTVFRAGDVLYGKLRPYLNKVTVPSFDGICSTDILVFSKRPWYDSRFLMYYLSTPQVVGFANHNSTGVQLPRIGFETLGTLDIPLPPLDEQRRIVSAVETVLAKVNAARERLNRVPAILKRFRQAVLSAACSGLLTEEWRINNAPHMTSDSYRELLLNLPEPNQVELGLQTTWPVEAMSECPNLKRLLIGVSSSYSSCWTHNQRVAPAYPRPDAWIYVPGQMLLVFESKNDDFPVDATQISAYAHALGLLVQKDNVPRAEPGYTLATASEAQAVQKACSAFLLDVSWATVATALRHVEVEAIGDRGGWLCGQAATYVQSHIKPSYHGPGTILDWLSGPDEAERRSHLRRLVAEMGNSLAASAQGLSNAITFRALDNGEWDIKPSADCACYVNINRDGKSLKLDWLGDSVSPGLWFNFNEYNTERIGITYYRQAPGENPSKKGAEPWNQARTRHMECAHRFEELMTDWSRHAPAESRVYISTVRFKGKKQNWQGGGDIDREGPESGWETPLDALTFLKKHRTELWCFPSVGPEADVKTVEEAAPRVRKPTIALLIPLDVEALAECGRDRLALQEVLKKALATM